MRRAALIGVSLALVAASLLLTACQSTQDKAKKLQAEGKANAAVQPNLTIAKPDKSIKVLDTALLHDQYGDAVAVELKNTGKQVAVNAPILVDLIGPGGASVGKNDAPGLDLSLNHVPLIEPGETVVWVNDQLQPTAQPKSARVVVGPSEGAVPKGPLPEIEVDKPKVENNPSGILATGSLKNMSQIDQLKLTVFVVARSGRKIVAAGRGVVKILKVDRPGKYSAFFIGDPKGSQVTVTAPPSTLR